MTTVIDFGDLPSLEGTDLGYSEWLTVDQERIGLFADATDDHQWIHTDPEKAASGPFGTTIAHGFLTLSLGIRFWGELLEVNGTTTKVNYGLDKVRFVSPVPVGAKIRMRAVVAEVTAVGGDGYQLSVDQTIEVEGGSKPAVAARGLFRFYA